MFVFSENIISFTGRLKFMADEIIFSELGFEEYGDTGKFIYGRYNYKYGINIFEGGSSLGCYDHAIFEIGINISLMYTARNEVIKNILRHEIAHMMVYIAEDEYAAAGNMETAHGPSFQDFCRIQGWGKEISKAYDSVEVMNEQVEFDPASEKIISKVKKLLRLAESSNLNEAKLATVKANEILLRYNLSLTNCSQGSDERFYLRRLFSVTRKNAKLKAIAAILSTFYVAPVYKKGKGVVYLEVVGNRANVEIASHVAAFLNYKLDLLWQETRKAHPHLKGLRAKNSFLYGVGQGYAEKIKKVKNELKEDEYQAVMIVENDLERMKGLAYDRLSNSYSSAKHDIESGTIGKNAGRRLTINQTVSGSSETFLLS